MIFFVLYIQIQNGLIIEIGQGKGAVNNNKIYNALALPNGELCSVDQKKKQGKPAKIDRQTRHGIVLFNASHRLSN